MTAFVLDCTSYEKTPNTTSIRFMNKATSIKGKTAHIVFGCFFYQNTHVLIGLVKREAILLRFF